jgi:hypothetical protein
VKLVSGGGPTDGLPSLAGRGACNGCGKVGFLSARTLGCEVFFCSCINTATMRPFDGTLTHAYVFSFLHRACGFLSAAALMLAWVVA